MSRVIVGMSGGVDSSVAAALLKEQGYDVVGLTIRVKPADGSDDDIRVAQAVAQKLGIAHHTVDCRKLFDREVVDHFCAEYGRGRTPNPCVRCNERVKFSVLFDKAHEMDAEFIATGHYARIEKDIRSKKYHLKKGRDRGKDQSYFLYFLRQDIIGRILLPLGGMKKEDTRILARAFGLASADREESRDVCFVAGGDYRGFVGKRMPRAGEPGPILDREGNLLGQHCGILSYTIGQRKGMGISAEEPLYVTGIDVKRNAIIVGNKSDVYSDELVASNLNWTESGTPKRPIEVKAKIRYRHREGEAIVTPLPGNEVRVKFTRPQMAITPGQSVVFYRGSIVVGGGTIEREVRSK
ncbi:MAG: tRNA 2-thiouridine(34) synthase MnmA [Dehalococcoidia bacterium]|jgi:tRNA-specific 2-thiouridylase